MLVIFYYLNLCVIEDVLEKIYIRNVLCKKEDNKKKHVVNEYEIMKELRDKLKNELEV